MAKAPLEKRFPASKAVFKAAFITSYATSDPGKEIFAEALAL